MFLFQEKKKKKSRKTIANNPFAMNVPPLATFGCEEIRTPKVGISIKWRNKEIKFNGREISYFDLTLIWCH